MSFMTYPCRNNIVSTTAIRDTINSITENEFTPFSAKETTANIVDKIGSITSTLNKEKNNTALRLFVTYFSDSMSMNMICQEK